MNKSYIITYDIGTTGAKTCILDQKLRVVASDFVPYETYYLKENWATQKPIEWWEAVCKSTKKLIESSKIKTKEIMVVGVDGQCPLIVPIGDNNELLLNEIPMFSDIRATEQAKGLINEIGGTEKLYKIIGSGRQAMLSVCKAMWIKDNYPDIYKKVYKFLATKDYINMKLTGVLMTDYSDFCASGFMDINKRKLSEIILGASGIKMEKIPEIQESHQILGYINREAAQSTGLGKGTPVITGAADCLCASIGSGVIDKGKACMSIGSVNWTSIVVDKPFLNPNHKVTSQLPFPWENAYSPLIETFAGGLSQEWFKNEIYKSEELIFKELGLDIYDFMNKKVEEINPGSDGLLFLPYLKAEGPPYYNPNLRASFIGMSMYHTREHMLRAVFEGICFNMKILLSIFEKNGVMVNNYKEIKVVSGGALSKNWMQCYSDILNMQLAVVEEPRQVTAKGIAMVAGVGIGMWKNFSDATSFIKINKVYKPQKKLHKKYKKLFEIYEKYSSKVLEICNDLAEWREGKY